MQSVYKFPIAMAVLAQVEQGKLKLDQKIRVETSDIVQGSRILDKNSQGVESTLAELQSLFQIRWLTLQSAKK